MKIFAKFIQDAQLLGTVHNLRDLLGGGGVKELSTGGYRGEGSSRRSRSHFLL